MVNQMVNGDGRAAVNQEGNKQNGNGAVLLGGVGKDNSKMGGAANTVAAAANYVKEGISNWWSASVAGFQSESLVDFGKRIAIDTPNPETMAVGLVAGIAGTLGKMERAATGVEEALKYNPCKCFVVGTPIQTPHGTKPIEKIAVGDLVAARDEKTGETVWKPVLRLIRNGEKDVLHVRYVDAAGRSETLGVTPEHPFMLQGQRWVHAGDLQPGDKIMRLNDGFLTVKSVKKYSVRHHTFNFEVADVHTYFVGTMGAWVHNAGPCDITKAINLPGWRAVTVDMVHVAERHMEDGARVLDKSVFVGLNERGVMAAIKQAYGSATTVAVQGERVLLEGITKTGTSVQMWLNRTTKTIETAYPVAR